jgi:hypothetical protein
LQRNISVMRGKNNLSLDLADAVHGIYFCRINYQNQSQTHRFVISR